MPTKCQDCTTAKCADCVTMRGSRISRRQFVKQAVCSGLALSGLGALLSACVYCSGHMKYGSTSSPPSATHPMSPSSVRILHHGQPSA